MTYTPPPAAPTYAPVQRTNTLAIVGFVLSFFVSVGAVVVSHIALSQIKRTGEGGHGLAIAGLIIGYVGIALGVLWFLFIGLAIMSAIIGGTHDYGYYNS